MSPPEVVGSSSYVHRRSRQCWGVSVRNHKHRPFCPVEWLPASLAHKVRSADDTRVLFGVPQAEIALCRALAATGRALADICCT